MAIIDDILKQGNSVAAPTAPQESWVSNLIDRKFQPQQARVKRNPVGFEFKREPFDPSEYYKAIGLYHDISVNATAVTRQEAANHANALQQQAFDAMQSASNKALGGVNPNFTYDSNFKATGISRKYGLKRVSSNTAKAADYWGSKYGIKNIGGYSAHGSVPGSDHPKGRALDFMINNIKNGKKTGTALANDLIKNYKKWNIKYVIWNRYIWTPSRGWHKYSGPSPHTDHVHASFNK